jgi:hypothetical protein
MSADTRDSDVEEIVIMGLTPGGRAFRPSDWAERLCGMMSIFGEERRLSYSPYLKPIMAGEVRCVVVDPGLEMIDPAAFAFLMGFARDNELTLRPGRKPGNKNAVDPERDRRHPDEASGLPVSPG